MGSSSAGGSTIDEFLTSDRYETRAGLQTVPVSQLSSVYPPIKAVGQSVVLPSGERVTVVKSDSSLNTLKDPSTFWGPTRASPNLSFGVL